MNAKERLAEIRRIIIRRAMFAAKSCWQMETTETKAIRAFLSPTLNRIYRLTTPRRPAKKGRRRAP